MLNRRTLLLSSAMVAAGHRPGGSAGLSGAADPHHRAARGRRHGGYPGARDRREAQRSGPHRGGREPHRRLGRDRRGCGREVAGRRLHAADGPARHAGDPRAHDQAALRPGEGFRAGDPRRDRAERAADQQFGPGQLLERADRPRQGQSRQAHLRLAGQRLDRPHDRRAVQGDGRHRPDARAVSRRRAREPGPARRPRQHAVRHRAARGLQSAERQGARACGLRARSA